MSGQWHRDAGGYYRHAAYPRLLVRETGRVAGCSWQVCRSSVVYGRIEEVGRYKTLRDAKRSVEDSGGMWQKGAQA